MARDTRYDLYPQLTKREQEVYKLMVTTPLTKCQIAESLHLASGTINTHVLNILNKFCAKNRYELIINHYKQQEDKQ